MNIKTTETTLAKYHVLHLVVGFIFALILLLVPKIAGAVICTLLLGFALPPAILPEFEQRKWLGTALIVAGAIIAGCILQLLHRL